MPSGHGTVPTPKNKNNKTFQQISRNASSISSKKISVYQPTNTNKFKQVTKNTPKSYSSTSSSATSGSKEVSQAGKKQVSTSSTSSSEYEARNVQIPSSNRMRHKKIGCNCGPCSSWNVKDVNNSEDEEEFIDTKQKCRKVIVKPSLLFKKDDEKQQIEIKTLSTTSAFLASKGSKVKDPAVLVHGYVSQFVCVKPNTE